MGDVPSKAAVESTTNLPKPPLSLDLSSNRSLPHQRSVSTSIASMANLSTEALQEPIIANFVLCQKILDYEVRSRSLELEEQNLRAKLDSVVNQKEELRVSLEEAKQRSIQLQQRRERQEVFRDSLNEWVIAALKDTASVDNELQVAIQEVASGHLDEAYLGVLKCRMIEQLVGVEGKDWASIAVKLLDDSTAEESKTPSNHQSNLVNGQAAQDICSHDTSSGHRTREHTVISRNTSEDQVVARTEIPEVGIATGTASIQGVESSCATVESEIAELDSDGFEVNTELTSAHEVAGLFGIGEDTALTDNNVEDPTMVIKCEDHVVDNVLSPPSAKRRKLTEIENGNEPLQLAFNISTPSSCSPSTLVSSISNGTALPDIILDDTIHPSSPVPVNRASIASSDVGSKRSRNDLGISSPAPINQKSKNSAVHGNRKLPPAAKQFLQRVKDTIATGDTVAPEMKCQKCQNTPEDPKLSACAHLYCNKCVTKLRKLALKADKIACCVACDREIGKRCTPVTKDQVEEWRKEYATDKGEDGDGNAGDDEIAGGN